MRRKWGFHWLSAALAAVMLWCGLDPARAQETGLEARDLHVWGRFCPGTWKQVRLITETVGPNGEITGTTTTETKTTLVRAGANSVTLQIDVTVEVGGKRFQGQSQTVESGFFSEDPGDTSKLKPIGSEQLTIDGRHVTCKIHQVTAGSGQRKQTTRFFLSNDVEPFVLKRETFPISTEGDSSKESSTLEVIALDMPYKVLNEQKTAAFERAIQRTERGTTVTLDVTCVDVPGGVVARTSKELDAQGKIVRRSTLELVNYHVVLQNDEDEPPRYLTRRQMRKARKGK